MDSEARRTAPERPPDAAPDADQEPGPASLGPFLCAAHPSVETYLRCGRCDRPICPRCLIQTPVGARCRECARLRKLPMFEVGPRDYLKAVGAGLGAAYAGGVVLTLLQAMVPFFGFLGLLLMLGLGYVVGEAVSRATGLKRGNGVGAVAALAVPVGLGLARASFFALGGAAPAVALSAGFGSLLVPLWTLLGVLVAAGLAYSRLR